MKRTAASIQNIQEDPAILLEKIMQAEIRSAERISEVKKDADRQIAKVQEDAENSKKEAYANGRRARARLIENGILRANAAAEEKLHLSESKTSKIIENGEKFIPQAVALGLDFILGSGSKEISYDSQNGKD